MSLAGLALGVDVSKARGLDLVVLDPERRVVEPPLRKQQPKDLIQTLHRLRPDVVAIDSPSFWATQGRSRLCERRLLELGVHCFFTPIASRGGNPFYDWMREGHKAFAAATAAGYPLYRSGTSVAGRAIEVFPHASAVALKGTLPPFGFRKRQWRAAILEVRGVATGLLTSQDALDAALAALTGLLALKQEFIPIGDPEEGVIAIPCRDLPERFERERFI